VATHVKVDPDLLDQVAGQLGEIASALRSADARAREDRGVLGHGGLASAMAEFVGNWRVHRERLLSSVEAHQKMASHSADAYRRLDDQLGSLLDPGPGAAGGPR
jgi:N-acetylglucosamine-6-phosphate deacetylase